MPSLEEALEFESNGQVQRCGKMLVELYEENSQDFETAFHYGRFLVSQGNGKEGYNALMQAKDMKDSSPFVWFELGRAYELLDRADGVENCFYNAAELARGCLPVGKVVEFYRNYLNFYLRYGRFEDVETYIKPLRTVEGAEEHVKEYDSILAFIDGKFDECLSLGQEIYVNDPQVHEALLPFLLLALLYVGDVVKLDSFVEVLKQDSRVHKLTPEVAKLVKEMALYVQGIDESRLAEVQKLHLPYEETSKIDEKPLSAISKAIVGYAKMLDSLYHYYTDHKSNWSEKEVDGNLYVIGDSHSLPPAHLNVRLDGETLKVVPQLAVGIKAWVVASRHACRSLAAFKWRIANLPKNSKVVLSAGEIDCRFYEGFLKYLQQNPEVDTREYVSEVVADYVDECMSLLESRSPEKVMFLNVPAPIFQEDIPDLSLKVSEVVFFFNDALRTAAEKHGAKIVDVYALTKDDKQGFSKGDWHVDMVHLNAGAFVEALS